MAKRLKKSYKFAFRSSLFIVITLTFLLGIYQYLVDKPDWILLIGFFLIAFAVSFFVVQYRVERFIYKRIKKIYDDVSLLESSSLSSAPITTDIKTLTEEIERFAEGKKVEIDTLKIRDEYRKDFLGNVSHELKTPLFTVQGYILTLLDGALDDKKVRKKYLERAAKGVDRLIYIVQDLDLITKLETEGLKMKLESFDILELIQNVFDLLEINASKKKISLTFDMEHDKPIYVQADKERMQQVLSNLLTNSIKYGHPNGTTEVSVENLIKNKVIVRVTDNGEGIAQDHIPRLFERFYRVDKTGNRDVGGSGLGLSIVKHIIEAHNEKIYVESAVDVGSEFSFTLEKSSEE